jgi:heme/copper-type cytochrome/quinol oxidase subunit 4
MQLLIGFILGIIVSAIGFTTVAQFADTGVQKIQEVVKETVR